MATAVKNSADTTAANPQLRLVVASFVGAVYILAGLAAVLYGVPQLWRELVTPHVAGALGSFVDVALRLVVQLAVLVALVRFGSTLAGANPPKGIRGGIFLAVSAIITTFFLARLGGAIVRYYAPDQAGLGFGVMGAVAAACLVFAFRFMLGSRGQSWMHHLEEQGWFSVEAYKPTQGRRVRRLTMLGIILIGGTGVYAMHNQGMLASGHPDWRFDIPFTQTFVTFLTDKQFSVVLLLFGLTLWVAWRAVNYPTFADFLIATEAEMNKVSWATRRQLVRDTIVVLITTFLMTVFLFAVDQFWGFLLSSRFVGVLPRADKETITKTAEQRPGGQQPARW